ncbi:MAG TPA: undecaprenyl-diphosphate phosphatase [Candidatus Eisenbacteria bacterium]
MDILLLLKALVLGVVEGFTEFLPISSTGHLIVAASLLRFTPASAAAFEIAIQTGAMLAVVWEYRARIGRTVAGLASRPADRKFALNLAVAFLPAMVFGLAFGKLIKRHLFHPVPVAIAFAVGGVIILLVEGAIRRRGAPPRVGRVDDMSLLDALKVGLVQCLALIPGTSRSGATIIGGLVFGLSRPAATEFSFFLAVPTLMAAGAYSLYKERDFLTAADLPLFLVGTVVSFVSALVVIRWLIRYVAGHDFTAFAWYRIAFGAIILWTAWSGLVSWNP